METIQEKNWWQRHWKWALPVGGCGCGCLVIILLFVFGIGAAFFGFSDLIEEAAPVKQATEIAAKNETVRAIIGTEIATDGFPNGTFSLQNDDGDVDFSISIKGTKGAGTLFVKGIKSQGAWVYEELYVVPKGKGEQINLLDVSLEYE